MLQTAPHTNSIKMKYILDTIPCVSFAGIYTDIKLALKLSFMLIGIMTWNTISLHPIKLYTFILTKWFLSHAGQQRVEGDPCCCTYDMRCGDQLWTLTQRPWNYQTILYIRLISDGCHLWLGENRTINILTLSKITWHRLHWEPFENSDDLACLHCCQLFAILIRQILQWDLMSKINILRSRDKKYVCTYMR